MKKETIIKNSKMRGGRPPAVHKDKRKYDRKRDKKIKYTSTQQSSNGKTKVCGALNWGSILHCWIQVYLY